MEELSSFIPFIIIIVLSAVTSAAKKKKQQQEQSFQARMRATREMKAAQQAMQQPAPAAPLQPSMSSMLPIEPHTVAQPTVHTHLEPDCDVHDAPTSGSLGVRSTEGKDPCHADQLAQMAYEPLSEPAAATSGLALEWSGDALVKAFVMQEVLTRPCDRRR